MHFGGFIFSAVSDFFSVFSDPDEPWTGKAAVVVRQLVVQVAGRGGAIGRRAMLRSANMCIRGMCEKSAERRVVCAQRRVNVCEKHLKWP